MTDTTTEKKTHKITLSERRPVAIALDDWPVIADAERFWGGSGHACQANEEGFIRVRQHADGRTLVYCSRHRGPGGMPIDYRGAEGGYLLPTPNRDGFGAESPRRNVHNELEPTQLDQIIRAIRRCAGIIGADELADECIGNLPAEEI